jgi:hypothetical protein
MPSLYEMIPCGDLIRRVEIIAIGYNRRLHVSEKITDSGTADGIKG